MHYLSKYFLHSILILPIIFLCSSCANIKPPVGGPKDTQAPKLINSVPEPNQLNFHDRKIHLEFNEDINSQSIQEQLIITPYTDVPFKINARRNIVDIVFEKSLADSTTYTLNFRESLKDISEGNVASSLTLAFSTGSTIDSNQILGKLKIAETNTPAKDITVGLYPPSDSISAVKNKPIYFTKSNAQGSYIIKNVKKGNYQLIAINDINKNLLFNDGELMGVNKKITFDTSTINYDLLLTKYTLKKPEVKNIKEEKSTISIKLKLPIDTFLFKTKQDIEFYPILTKDKKTITLFKTINYKDSIEANLVLIDSAGNKATEDIKFKIEKFEKVEKSPLAITYNPQDKIKPGEIKIEINSSKPIVKYNENLFVLKEDSVERKITKNEIKKISYTKLEITTKIKANDSLILIIKDKAIQSIDTSNSTSKNKWEIKKPENYSILEIKIETQEPNYIIQLLNDKNEIVDQSTNIKRKTYEYVTPGSYKLRAIIDTNKNGKWDEGNILTNEEPEKMLHMGTKIELRANWEVKDVIFKF